MKMMARSLEILDVFVNRRFVMDRGYVDFDRLARIHAALAFFVTRAKANMSFYVSEALNNYCVP